MLPKKNRADKKAVERIFKEGKFINSPSLSFKFISTPTASLPRISFIVPKSVSKKSVERNSLRRKGYVVLQKYINNLPKGLIGAFVFKKALKSSLELEKEVEIIFSRL